MTFEGTPWERSFISSIRTHSPGTRILAYIHNCVPLSESNFFLTPSEIKYMPKPDADPHGKIDFETIENPYGIDIPGDKLKTHRNVDDL